MHGTFNATAERWQVQAKLLQLAHPVRSLHANGVGHRPGYRETRSLVITPTHAIMFQVLTGMRTSHAHRLWSASRFLRPRASTQHLVQTGQPLSTGRCKPKSVRGTNCSQRVLNTKWTRSFRSGSCVASNADGRCELAQSASLPRCGFVGKRTGTPVFRGIFLDPHVGIGGDVLVAGLP